ncbi:MAG: ADP-ribosylglycohydrolase family protein [Spirochaetes bacterium]|nr:ADP-ribosylglycohydrolase family protein [Spirochaetota bacterium]MBU1080766.1 ADP-ribosylglycohydrolase family protein [Spirochaetota bacterium]
MEKAWEREFELRRGARPPSGAASDWTGVGTVLEARKALLSMLWYSEVPGSRAPERAFVDMIQAWNERGFDVAEAEASIDEAIAANDRGDHGALEVASARILAALARAKPEKGNPSWDFARPESYDDIRAAFPKSRPSLPPLKSGIPERVLSGWIGQIAGGSYGTALEGYTGDVLRETFGERMSGYVVPPESLNDDVTYELAALRAIEESGDGFSALDVGREWLRIIPFGWSAEMIALDNLRRGVMPPASGREGNWFSEWIGAQMRTMVHGFVAAGDPDRAASYAWRDSVVSHTGNGVYGGIHAAVMTSLAFRYDDARELLAASRAWIPDGTEFASVFDEALAAARASEGAVEAWKRVEPRFRRFNWIHVFPNLAAVVIGLWFSRGDIGTAFRAVADCGLDVDCNAGEVGSILGAMNGYVGTAWSDPLGGVLETYVPGYERVTFEELRDWTMRVSDRAAREAGR